MYEKLAEQAHILNTTRSSAVNSGTSACFPTDVLFEWMNLGAQNSPQLQTYFSNKILDRTIMSFELGYEIVESESKGKIVIATRDFLPGAMVLEEKEPVMFLSAEFLKQYQQYDPTDTHINLASFIMFMKRMEPKKKEILLSLYGPTTGVTAENLRLYASLNMKYSPDNISDPRTMTPEEVELFVKVSNVVRLNMFGMNDGKAVFAEITRFSHSCAPNCSYSSVGKGICCRTIKAVKAGEELAFSYDTSRDLQPTHVRRHKYLEAKEFTCHCPRCDALGDDTRQFDCCNPVCSGGVMMVCQPCNKEEVRVTNLPYTDVEYVEPHLLPCTVCHLTPPPAYQAKMLALEAKLPDLATQFENRQLALVNETRRSKWQALLDEILSLKLPRRHQMVVPIHNIIMKIHRFEFFSKLHSATKSELSRIRDVVQRAAREYIAAQEGITGSSSFNTLNIYYHACQDCIVEWQNVMVGCPPIFPPLEAKQLLQTYLRMRLIRFSSRDTRKAELDAALLKILEQLPPQKHTQVCAFCEESPLRAAVTLSRCARCKQVCYCSAGCQKAHWTLHKKTCKAL